MSPLDLLLFVVVVPAVVAALLVVMFGWAGRQAGVAGAGPAAIALALGAGAIAAQVAIAGPAFPPIEVTDRIPWLVLAAVVLGLCESIHPSPAWARWENRLLLGVLVVWAVLAEPVLKADWSTRRNLAVQGGLVLAIFAAWMNLEILAARKSTMVLGPSLLVVATGTDLALLFSGSVVLGRIGGGLTAALGAAWVVSWWRPDRSMSRGGVPVLVVTVAALLIVGHVYSGLPLSAAVLLAAAPLLLWLAWVGPARRLASWQSSLLAAALVLLPAGVAVGLAFQAAPGGYE
jgi:hypothetical protein